MVTSTLKMDAIRSSGTLVTTNKSTRRHDLKDQENRNLTDYVLIIFNELHCGEREPRRKTLQRFAPDYLQFEAIPISTTTRNLA